MQFMKMGILAAAVAGVMGMATQVHANSIDPTSGTYSLVSSGGGLFTYAFDMSVSSNSEVDTNDYFALTIPNLVSDSGPNASWTATTPAGVVTVAPSLPLAQQIAVASPAALYTYTGAGISGAPSGTDLGVFKFTTTGATTGLIIGGAQYHLIVADTLQSNSISLVAAPLPNAAYLGMGTLAGLGAVGALRKRLVRA